MNFESHLFIGIIITIGLSILFQFLFGFNISDNLIILGIAVFLFSNISDIDNANAKISAYFFVFYLGLIIYGITKIIDSEVFKGIFIILGGLISGGYHIYISVDSWEHRNFPHTVIFGTIVFVIFWIFSQSFFPSLIGFFCFLSHLVLDGHWDWGIDYLKF